MTSDAKPQSGSAYLNSLPFNEQAKILASDLDSGHRVPVQRRYCSDQIEVVFMTKEEIAKFKIHGYSFGKILGVDEVNALLDNDSLANAADVKTVLGYMVPPNENKEKKMSEENSRTNSFNSKVFADGIKSGQRTVVMLDEGGDTFKLDYPLTINLEAVRAASDFMGTLSSKKEVISVFANKENCTNSERMEEILEHM